MKFQKVPALHKITSSQTQRDHVSVKKLLDRSFVSGNEGPGGQPPRSNGVAHMSMMGGALGMNENTHEDHR
ncbi:hypothetical protein FP2506_07396 [Fulvimarina pelagi HTCC2506]|uniref:Uncharacterized protein n=1 Tax=Fulvimarina pelagi HTCC2506 TaxID=314231 RepID=Q0G6R7_9HYPH|nr:hypothetical protein FP2506_07396 [Fulvimarina pelagi HTCC2506]